MVANKNSNSERLVSVKVNSGNVSEAVLHQRLLQGGQLACAKSGRQTIYIVFDLGYKTD